MLSSCVWHIFWILLLLLGWNYNFSFSFSLHLIVLFFFTVCDSNFCCELSLNFSTVIHFRCWNIWDTELFLTSFSTWVEIKYLLVGDWTQSREKNLCLPSNREMQAWILLWLRRLDFFVCLNIKVDLRNSKATDSTLLKVFLTYILCNHVNQ